MTGRPRPHPDPPAGFDSVELPISWRSRRWFRTHRRRRNPVFFGKTGSSTAPGTIRGCSVLRSSIAHPTRS